MLLTEEMSSYTGIYIPFYTDKYDNSFLTTEDFEVNSSCNNTYPQDISNQLVY